MQYAVAVIAALLVINSCTQKDGPVTLTQAIQKADAHCNTDLALGNPNGMGCRLSQCLRMTRDNLPSRWCAEFNVKTFFDVR